MNLRAVITLLGEISVLISATVPMIIWMYRVTNGTKCQLRSEMLRIYYHNHEQCEIRQYEYQNFVYLYEAYKALKGNSFIDKIYKEVQTWEVIT